MIRYFAAHPTAANILMFIILLLGLAALPGLNKETFPEIDFHKVQVTVAYPGASASEVEEGICNRSASWCWTCWKKATCRNSLTISMRRWTA
jgi:HAE1 family hydrophobic/amphiphilic exporter-1